MKHISPTREVKNGFPIGRTTPPSQTDNSSNVPCNHKVNVKGGLIIGRSTPKNK